MNRFPNHSLQPTVAGDSVFGGAARFAGRLASSGLLLPASVAEENRYILRFDYAKG
jgi:hypothetical protein